MTDAKPTLLAIYDMDKTVTRRALTQPATPRLSCMRLMMNTKDWLAYYNTTAYPMLWSDRQPDPSGRAMNFRDKSACEYTHGNDFHWNPISASALHSTAMVNATFRSKYQLNYSM
eukprot:gene11557-15445_t